MTARTDRPSSRIGSRSLRCSRSRRVLLLWNAWRYDWLRGYDAFADDQYAKILSTEYRLPSVRSPTLAHAAALVRPGRRAPPRGELDGLGAGAEAGAAARRRGRARRLRPRPPAGAELWPGRRMLHLVALVLTSASPALVRASAMYHPETLAAALATGGVLVAVRGLRTRSTLSTASVQGRSSASPPLPVWALPVLVAVLVAVGFDAWRRRAGPPAALLATSLALLAPWLANEEVAHGSALAFNRPPPPGSFLARRPASFYLGPRALRVFDHPVTPLFRNELLPHLYADWWGDWALTWNSPPPPAPAQLLPAGWSPTARDRCSSASCRRSSRSPGSSRSPCSPARGGLLRSPCCP